ncbi:MAG: hypothetical protein JW701_03160 [Kosmotogaceae bacterium]|nr:hypothetical protein [Kosmotogaceae bacterium]
MKRIAILIVFFALVLILTSCFPGSFPRVPKTLLIDDSHNNRIDAEASVELSKLIRAFEDKGYTVDLSSESGFAPEGYGVVLVLAPRTSYSVNEMSGLVTLLSRGGKVLLLGEYYSYYDSAPLNAIASYLEVGIQFNNNLLHDNTNNYDNEEIWVTTTKFNAHPLTTGLNKIVLIAASTLNTSGEAQTIAYAEPTSYVPISAATQESLSGVVAGKGSSLSEFSNQVTIVVPLIAAASVGSGKVVAIGDINLFSDDIWEYISGDFIDLFDNRKLLNNIIDW